MKPRNFHYSVIVSCSFTLLERCYLHRVFLDTRFVQIEWYHCGIDVSQVISRNYTHRSKISWQKYRKLDRQRGHIHDIPFPLNTAPPDWPRCWEPWNKISSLCSYADVANVLQWNYSHVFRQWFHTKLGTIRSLFVLVPTYWLTIRSVILSRAIDFGG